jgi:phytanoyl-CoA hydroxylase
MALLSAAQRREWADGFLIIPGFFDEAELQAAVDAYKTVWEELPSDVVVDSVASGRRVRAKDVTDAEREASFKVNDLYLRDAELRKAVLSARLGAILKELLSDDPVVVNTLSVEYGTQQYDHLDTLYMTPRTPGSLVATWMALEDVDENAGPLRYYPESNHIEPYRFEDGSFHIRDPELEHWADYMANAVDRRGLAETRFMAKRGDLFIWDAWLLHGGSEICTPGLTRRSLITHYYSKTDCAALGSQLRPAEGGYWMKRSPQAVPGEDPAQTAAYNAVLDDIEPIPGVTPPATEHQVKQPQPLYERMAALDPNDT